MEASGHYYTVYYTSLAVGFSEKLAYQHAVLSQLPDQVSWLDATNLHLNDVHVNIRRFEHPSPIMVISKLISDSILNSNTSNMSTPWRFKVQYVLHALISHKGSDYMKSTEVQRDATRDLLISYRADTIEFGLLLHRLGDTYAHSVIGDESKPYTTTFSSNNSFDFWMIDNMGHLRNGHEPDYWYLREDLFFDYLNKLYQILSDKFKENHFHTEPRRSYRELERSFREILKKIKRPNYYYAPRYLIRSQNTSCVKAMGMSVDENKVLIIIREIRKEIKSLPNISNIENYAPEFCQLKTLSEFSRDTGLMINGHALVQADLEDVLMSLLKELYKIEGISRRN